MELNREQKKAVKYNEGPLRLVAGPGAGKTRTIVEKVKYLISEGVEQNKIIIITFTTKAVKEIRERLGQYNIKKVNVETYHGFCRRVLDVAGSFIGKGKDWRRIDQYEQIKEIRSYFGNFAREEISEFVDYMSYKNSTGKPKYISSEIMKEKYEYAMKKYSDMKVERKLIDLDDLMLLVRELFNKCPEVAKKYSELLEFVMVDEFQDTNKLQFDIITSFKEPNSKVTIVGDIDQNIYGWRGGESVLMMSKVDEYFKNLKTLYLKTNYRSGLKIISAAKKLIKNNNDRFEDFEMNPHTGSRPGIVEHKIFKTSSEESRYIANAIKTRFERGVQPSEIAIIVRTSSNTEDVEKALKSSKINYKLEGARSFFERKEIKQILAAAHILNEVNKDSIELASNELPIRMKNKTGEVMSFIKDKECSVTPSVKNFVQLVEKYSFNKTGDVWSSLREFLKEIKIWNLGKEKDMFSENISEVSSLFKNQKYIKKEVDEVLSNIITKNGDEGSVGRVLIMTAHASKGTEYEVVFLPSFVEGHWPSSRAMEGSNEFGLEEERRVAYVAFTRAKYELIITSPKIKRFREVEISRYSYEAGIIKDKKNSTASWVECEACLSGKVIKKKSNKGGVFYACDRFPKCRHTMKFADFMKALKEKRRSEKEEW